MVNVPGRFINGGRIFANVDEAGNPYPADAPVNANTNQNGMVPNTVPAYFYTDLTANYTFGDEQTIRAFLNRQQPASQGGGSS